MVKQMERPTITRPHTAPLPPVRSTTSPPRSSGLRARLRDRRIVLAVALLVLFAAIGAFGLRIYAGRSVDVAGVVTDSRTNKPVGSAQISGPDISLKTNAFGAFTIADIPGGTELRFGSQNYHKTTLEASADPMRVKLRPIPVTGTVKSSFTKKGIGATVQGAEADKTKGNGAFTVYGVGPGDNLKVTAFAHAPLSVKIGKTREVNVSMKLGRIDPAALLKPVAGYGYVNAPPEISQQMRAEIGLSDPMIASKITGIAAKAVIKKSESVGFAMTMALDPALAALPDTRQDFMQGFSEDSASSKDITIGDVKVREVSSEGLVGYAWQQYAGFVMVFGESKADIEPFVRGLIVGRTTTA